MPEQKLQNTDDASDCERLMPNHIQIDFSAEFAVDKENIADGQNHAEAPPGQADGERVRTGDGAAECNVVRSAGGRGKQSRIETPARSSQHEK